MRSPYRCDDRRDTTGVRRAVRSRGRMVYAARSTIHLLTVVAVRPSVGAPEQDRSVGSSASCVVVWSQVQGPSGFIGQYPFR
jgi:hypothetical protein